MRKAPGVTDEPKDPSELDLADELGELTEELVSEEPAALTFLGRLLSLPAGAWHPMRPLVAELGEVATRIGIAEDAYKIGLYAMWNPCPAMGHGDGWAVVVIYSPEWHGVANTVLIDRRELASYRN